jgi:hypothetical protein
MRDEAKVLEHLADVHDNQMFDLRNGFVTLSILLVVLQAQREGKSNQLTIKNIIVRIQRLLNPEPDPPSKIAGISTCYPKLKALESLGRNRPGMVDKPNKGPYTVTKEGEVLIKKLIDELERFTSVAKAIYHEEKSDERKQQ